MIYRPDGGGDKNNNNNNNNNNNKSEQHNKRNKRKHVQIIIQLQRDLKKLSTESRLIRSKLELGIQTSQIRNQLLQKEFDQFKDDAQKKNRLMFSLFLKLIKPGMHSSASIKDLLSGLSPHDEELEDPLFLDNLAVVEARAVVGVDTGYDTLQQQQQQQQQQIELCNQRFEARDEKVKQEMMEKDKLLTILKEEVEKLKQKEEQQRALLPMHGFNVQEDETTFVTSNGRNRELYPGDENIEDHDDDDDSYANDDEVREDHLLPCDTYSYFAVAAYFKRGPRCYAPTAAFSLACFALVVQLVTLSIFIMDVVDINNPDNPIQVPPGVGIQVRVSQLIALIISGWNQDEIRASFNAIALGYSSERFCQIDCNSTRQKWLFSICTRMFLGWFSLVVTFLLVVNSNSVRDVMLDFAAVTFVSELDNGAFQLSSWGYMGKELQKLTVRMKNIPVYERPSNGSSTRRKKKLPRLLFLLVIICSVLGFWAWVTVWQSFGHYVHKAIFVQFGDEFSPAIGAFSGMYEIHLDDTIDGMRVNYVELGGQSDGRFSYCSQDGTWLFQYGDPPDGYEEWIFSACWHKAVSLETEAHDITKTSDITWFVRDEELQLELPMQHFFVKGQNYYYGKSCRNNDECGVQRNRMSCDMDSGTCVCEDGLFGLNCEFREPCQTLEIDSRDEMGFYGTRSWSRRYNMILPKKNEVNGGRNTPIQVYGKPVFIGDDSIRGIFDVMIFIGRRWILTDSLSFEDYHNNNVTSLESSPLLIDDLNDNKTINAKRELAEFLASNFHAYWSNYTFYFASEPVDAGTPKHSATPDGLRWFRLETSGTLGASLRSGEKIWQGKLNIEANLICTVCDNETNPCFYGATCTADRTCDCTTGSSGSICQIPPDHNGLCNDFFNTPEFNYDGGDCCQETCKSTEEYTCGKGIIEEFGVSAYGFIGYPNCQDPKFKSKLSGSTTLHDIVERGHLRCGSGVYPGFLEISDNGTISGFEADLCRSIAAAVLDNPEAMEIVGTTMFDRFVDLAEGKFDVLLFRTTHTAERDVYQSDAKVGFSFAPIPSFFDGLRYGGIPPYSECADKLDFESPECVDLRICVPGSTTWFEITERHFPDSMILAVIDDQAAVDGLEAGICNVIAGETSLTAEFSVRQRGFTGSLYELGGNVRSKEPLSAVTRHDDRVWSKFVGWIFEALIQAEESGITKSMAKDKFARTTAFGDQFQNMFQNAVAASGNFGEIYERNLENRIPRAGLNTINTGNTGLIYSFPFGAIESRGPDPIYGGVIESIRRRGVLNCGIKKTPGFAEHDPDTRLWRGFEIDMCRGIAAALFQGSPNVNFIPLGGSGRFMALAERTVDVMLCATTHTLAREVNELTTGHGFDFTPTIFYDGLGFGGRSPYVICAEIRRFATMQECADTKICVPDGSTWLDTMLGPLNIPAENIMVTESQEEVYQRYVEGDCNVIVGESAQIVETTVRQFGLDEDEEYTVGSYKFSKEPLAIVSRSDDAQFSDFLRWIVFGFFYAEEKKITSQTYFEMPANNYLFGGALSAMWQHSIEAVGNYGEIFERNFEGILERFGPNTLNDFNGPQLYSMPGVVIKEDNRR